MTLFWWHFWGLIWLDWLLDLGYALLINIIVWGLISLIILIIYAKIKELL